jgi:dihydroorotase
LEWPQLIDCLTRRPADAFKMSVGRLTPGAPADVVCFDPESEWTVALDSLHSKSKNSPYLGWALKGVVRSTLVAGQLVFDGRADAGAVHARTPGHKETSVVA